MINLPWIEALKAHLRFQRIVILHGNLHDQFPVDDRYRTIEEIVAEIGRSVGCPNAQIIDGALGDEINLQAPAREAELSQPEPEQILARVKPNGTKGPICWVIRNAQAIFPQFGSLERRAWRLQERLLRAVNAADDTHRFVLLFPEEDRIPENFLTGVPGVARLSIPLPDRDGRMAWTQSAARIMRQFGESSNLPAFVAATDGLRWRDLESIRRQCGLHDDPIRLVREFKYGQDLDLWAEATHKNLVEGKSGLLAGDDPIYGQEEAVHKALAVMAKASLNLTEIVTPTYNRPRGVLLFAGPTGVGKNMLAKKLAKQIFGTEDACILFDMAEYAEPQSVMQMTGVPAGDAGYEIAGRLPRAVRNRPISILVFDAIEKASLPLLAVLRQILNEGVLKNSAGEACYFSECFIIFTSNVGAADLMKGNQALSTGEPVRYDSQYELLQRYYYERLLQKTSLGEYPAILNLVGLRSIVPFRHLNSLQHARAVVDKLIGDTTSLVMKKYKVPIEIDHLANLSEFVAHKADFETFGMRNVRHTYDVEVLEPVSLALLESPKKLRVAVAGDRIAVSAAGA